MQRVTVDSAATAVSKNPFYPECDTVKVYSDTADGARSLVQWAHWLHPKRHPLLHERHVDGS